MFSEHMEIPAGPYTFFFEGLLSRSWVRTVRFIYFGASLGQRDRENPRVFVVGVESYELVARSW